MGELSSAFSHYLSFWRLVIPTDEIKVGCPQRSNQFECRCHWNHVQTKENRGI